MITSENKTKEKKVVYYRFLWSNNLLLTFAFFTLPMVAVTNIVAQQSIQTCFVREWGFCSRKGWKHSFFYHVTWEYYLGQQYSSVIKRCTKAPFTRLWTIVNKKKVTKCLPFSLLSVCFSWLICLSKRVKVFWEGSHLNIILKKKRWIYNYNMYGK